MTTNTTFPLPQETAQISRHPSRKAPELLGAPEGVEPVSQSGAEATPASPERSVPPRANRAGKWLAMRRAEHTAPAVPTRLPKNLTDLVDPFRAELAKIVEAGRATSKATEQFSPAQAYTEHHKARETFVRTGTGELPAPVAEIQRQFQLRRDALSYGYARKFGPRYFAILADLVPKFQAALDQEIETALSEDRARCEAYGLPDGGPDWPTLCLENCHGIVTAFYEQLQREQSQFQVDDEQARLNPNGSLLEILGVKP